MAPFTKTYANGVIDPVCNGSNDDHCAIFGPSTVPPHDLDQYKKGPNPDPEIWAAFMPVGFDTGNTYTAYANQLRPYLQKLVSFYRLGLPSNGKHYFVSNDIGDDYATTWDTFGPTNLDFYGKPGPNGETGPACISGSTNHCYKRWPTETYASSTAFIDAYRASPWVDEGWQTPSIFMGHMNSNRYDVAEVNVHSEDDNSLVYATEAKTDHPGRALGALERLRRRELRPTRISVGNRPSLDQRGGQRVCRLALRQLERARRARRAAPARPLRQLPDRHERAQDQPQLPRRGAPRAPEEAIRDRRHGPPVVEGAGERSAPRRPVHGSRVVRELRERQRTLDDGASEAGPS